MKYLFFDTETTGLPKNWKAPVTDVNNWPRMIQIAWILCDDDVNIIDADDLIILPENFEIPMAAATVHGITTKRATIEGVPLVDALNKFNELLEETDCIVGHNINFDEKIIGAEFVRKQIPTSLHEKQKICTMELATNFCKIPGPYGYKWPKLSELHIKLFGVDFADAHDAAIDINATAKCFWEMKRKGII